MRRHGSPAELEQLRRVAARLFDLERPTAEISHALDRDDQTVRRWRRQWKAGGVEALASKPHPGAKPRMAAEQWHELISLLAEEPQAYGYDAHLWTASLIGRLITDRFGVHYHHDYVGEMMHKLRWSPQRPAKQARERDEAEVERWRQVEWPAFQKKVPNSTP